MKTTRREFVKNSVAAAAVIAVSGTSFVSESKGSGNFLSEPASFILPPLPYDFAALEPHIDSLTMQIHHDKHHGGYVNNLNKAVAENNLKFSSLEEMLKNISTFPATVRNNGGGHWNHSLFWKLMKPGGGGPPSGKFAEALNSAFGSFDAFKNKFTEAAMKRFGSGWAWLVVQDGKLEIGSTPNQDNPLMDVSELKGNPVLALDVWEHAYYLKHQNKRADYINAWWNTVNWDEAAKKI